MGASVDRRIQPGDDETRGTRSGPDGGRLINTISLLAVEAEKHPDPFSLVSVCASIAPPFILVYSLEKNEEL